MAPNFLHNVLPDKINGGKNKLLFLIFQSKLFNVHESDDIAMKEAQSIMEMERQEIEKQHATREAPPNLDGSKKDPPSIAYVTRTKIR